MILRTLALLIGIPIVLLGFLATVIAVGMVGNPGQQGGPALIAAQVIVVVLMAGVTMTGAMLCWFGVRKRTARVVEGAPAPRQQTTAAELDTAAQQWESAGSATTPAIASQAVAAAVSSSSVAIAEPPAGQDDGFGDDHHFSECDVQPSYQVDMPIPHDDEATFHIGATGQLIGTCGPQMSGQLHYYLIGGLVIAAGLGMMIVLQFVHGAGDPATTSKIGLWGGGGLALFGGFLIALKLAETPQTISLYDDRLDVESGSRVRSIALDRITSLHLQEFYEHRFAPQTLLVTVNINGDRKLKFSTALGGDADLIVRCLADIAPDVVFREFA